jgi:excisionase family DNA binding protein
MTNQGVNILEYLTGVMRMIIREEFKALEESKPKQLKLHTSKQVIEVLGISESTFRRLIKKGTIAAVKVNGRIRVKDEILQELLLDVKSLKYKRK